MDISKTFSFSTGFWGVGGGAGRSEGNVETTKIEPGGLVLEALEEQTDLLVGCGHQTWGGQAVQNGPSGSDPRG